jgi:hypothetical protein
MNVVARRRFIAAGALGVALVGGGCASPLWQRDQYTVEGALLGTTCRASIDGRPYVGNAAGLGEKIQFVGHASSPLGVAIKTLVCRGIVLTFVSPEGARTATGRYRIANGAVGYDTGSVRLYIGFSGIKAGPWPFAFTGVHLEGKGGYLQLDDMTDSTARGTFHAVARRQPNGE